MNLYVSCKCGHQTDVTPAKCGGEVRCICGELIAVPPLGELRRTQEVNPSRTPLANTEQPASGPRPVRPIPLGFALLLFLYAGFQLLHLPRHLGGGSQMAGIALAVTAGSFATSVALYQFARRYD